jgi:hypothetical protein
MDAGACVAVAASAAAAPKRRSQRRSIFEVEGKKFGQILKSLSVSPALHTHTHNCNLKKQVDARTAYCSKAVTEAYTHTHSSARPKRRVHTAIQHVHALCISMWPAHVVVRSCHANVLYSHRQLVRARPNEVARLLAIQQLDHAVRDKTVRTQRHLMGPTHANMPPTVGSLDPLPRRRALSLSLLF